MQLGPLSPSRPLTHAHAFTLPIERDDVLILASDGLSDNLWDEDVLDEVVRMRRSFLPSSPSSPSAPASPLPGSASSASPPSPSPSPPTEDAKGLLGRRSLAGMLSEALCSRARRVSEQRPPKCRPGEKEDVDEEVPFARRAREQGKAFRGGKVDGECLVNVVSSAVG